MAGQTQECIVNVKEDEDGDSSAAQSAAAEGARIQLDGWAAADDACDDKDASCQGEADNRA